MNYQYYRLILKKIFIYMHVSSIVHENTIYETMFCGHIQFVFQTVA